ncbi:MAG: type II toxin-antitoxin system PemK/MazF family toxin [Planctomycetota bacterium]
MIDPKRGDVWLGDFPDYGTRPAIIVTRNQAIAKLTNVTLVVTTTRIRGWETEVVLSPERHGLRKTSVASCDNVLTVKKSYLIRRMGELDLDTMNAIDDAIKIALDLP